MIKWNVDKRLVKMYITEDKLNFHLDVIKALEYYEWEISRMMYIRDLEIRKE